MTTALPGVNVKIMPFRSTIENNLTALLEKRSSIIRKKNTTFLWPDLCKKIKVFVTVSVRNKKDKFCNLVFDFAVW